MLEFHMLSGMPMMDIYLQALHPKGRFMASGGRDWSVLLWDLNKPNPSISVRMFIYFASHHNNGFHLYSQRSPRDEGGVPTASPIARIDAHKGHITGLRVRIKTMETVR